jgi:hypothetical protein
MGTHQRQVDQTPRVARLTAAATTCTTIATRAVGATVTAEGRS